LGLWLPPSLGCLLTEVFFAFFISHACYIPTHLTCDLIILIKWKKNYEIIIMHLRTNCSNNIHCIVILKSAHKIKTIFLHVWVVATTMLAATETVWNIVWFYFIRTFWDNYIVYVVRTYFR
jgi:REP element-mobilizing transposase RayT